MKNAGFTVKPHASEVIRAQKLSLLRLYRLPSSALSLSLPLRKPATRSHRWILNVFPFATTVAETFGKTSDFKTPVIESTGSGGGLKLFCAGVGVEHPDITNASRRIKKSKLNSAPRTASKISLK